MLTEHIYDIPLVVRTICSCLKTLPCPIALSLLLILNGYMMHRLTSTYTQTPTHTPTHSSHIYTQLQVKNKQIEIVCIIVLVKMSTILCVLTAYLFMRAEHKIWPNLLTVFVYICKTFLYVQMNTTRRYENVIIKTLHKRKQNKSFYDFQLYIDVVVLIYFILIK